MRRRSPHRSLQRPLRSQRGDPSVETAVALARNRVLSLASYWHMVVIPGGAIVFLLLVWSLIGEILWDALEPRLRGHRL